jgi:hypothetical protein
MLRPTGSLLSIALHCSHLRGSRAAPPLAQEKPWERAVPAGRIKGVDAKRIVLFFGDFVEMVVQIASF